MSFGNFGGDDEVMAEINMTPLVDVMLVLLIIFMITMPVLTHAVKMNLPEASAAPPVDATRVTLAIDASGAYEWGGAPVDEAELRKALERAAAQKPQPVLALQADRGARYEPIARALAAAQTAGLLQVGFVTLPAGGPVP